jgi:hypothetical protein
MKPSIKTLKTFAQHILTEYQKVNENANASRLGIELAQFIHEGRIKDLVYKNTKLDEKLEILVYLKMSVENFARDWNKTVDIQNITIFNRKNRIKEFLKDGSI